MDGKGSYRAKLGEVTSMQSGIYLKTDPEGEISYLQVKDVLPGNEIDYDRLAMVRRGEVESRHFLRANDLLFAAKGASNFCFLYDGGEKGVVASSSFIVIRIKSKEVLSEFLCCFLNSPSVLGRLKDSSVGTGIQVIPQSVLGKLEVALPPVEVQRLLVEIDCLRKEGEHIQEQINELKRSVQDYLLVDGWMKRDSFKVDEL